MRAESCWAERGASAAGSGCWEGACVCAEGLCAPSFRAERGASAAGPFPRALGGLLVGRGRGCLAAPFPRRVGLGLVPRRLLVFPIARPLPLLPTPVPGGLAAGGLVVGCAYCVLPPSSLASLAAPRVPLPLFRTCALGLLVCGWWWSRPRVVPQCPVGDRPPGPGSLLPPPPSPLLPPLAVVSRSLEVSRDRASAEPAPPLPLPSPVAPRVPFPFLRTCALG